MCSQNNAQLLGIWEFFLDLYNMGKKYWLKETNQMILISTFEAAAKKM